MVSKVPKDDLELPLITVNSSRSQSPIANKKGQPGQKGRSGWKVTLSTASAACVVVLAFNLGFISWAAARHRVEGNKGVLYEGDCDHVRHLGTGIHFLINMFGTILLAASNYCMQCLCAPTRSDIDKEHAKGNWLDVGIPSIRNLFYVSKLRSFMWIVLVISSFPLHLLYNSTIFSTTAAYSYMIFSGPNPNGNDSPPNVTGSNYSDGVDLTLFINVRANLIEFYNDARNGSDEDWIQMDGSECIKSYATTYQTKYGDVLLIPPADIKTNQYKVVGMQPVFNPYDHVVTPIIRGDPFQWLCPQNPNVSCSSYVPSLQSQADQGNWVVHMHSRDYRADSCLSRRVPQLCKLQYSLTLTVTVIAANFIKGVVMLYMAVTSTEPPMLTTGDAAASFLHQPDKTTQRKCLVGQDGFRLISQKLHNKDYSPPAYSAKPKRWCTVVAWPRWTIIVLLWIGCMGACGLLLAIAILDDGKEIWDAQFGAISAQALIKGPEWPSSLINNTMIANTPQLMFSLFYFIFNSILTSMASAAEWSRFSVSRKGLRVSWNPQGSQRSRYFLSLPHRYAIPLMSCSVLLHWLISQSLFLVGIEAHEGRIRAPGSDLMTLGYNPRAIVSSLAIGNVMFFCLIPLGCKKLASGMPVAGSCTQAIAAACHPNYNPNDENVEQVPAPVERVELMPLKWGAVSVHGPVGHCTFTDQEVEMPQQGGLYQ